MNKQKAIVVGAGIVGLAHARALALSGFEVTVFDRNPQAVGASIRNFGMIWPLGQPDGPAYERAMRSRATWLQLAESAKLWYNPNGSLHIATTLLEATVMQEVAACYASNRGTRWLTAEEVFALSPAAHRQHTLGALWSPTELIVEARQAIRQLPAFFEESYGINFQFGTAISEIEGHTVVAGQRQWSADLIVVCSGTDFETLYPELFSEAPITKCKLQMMRLEAQPAAWLLGPSICGGLSLIHYKGFEVAASLAALKTHYQQTLTQYLQWGIHVMACQNAGGEITIGDTHEYGLHQDPFDQDWLNQLILDYFQQFAQIPSVKTVQSWNGIYAKMTNGATELVQEIGPATKVVTGLGGAGMTLSFGLAEELVDAWC
jgi:FAD dependent oxidoreductase TIGR03364